MKKCLLFFVFIICLQFTSFGQDNYINVIGVRGGNPTGVTYKHFIGRYSVIEGIAGINFSYKESNKNSRGITASITGLYEYHMYITEGLNVYGGGGMSIGGGSGIFLLHADAIVGLEYTISNFPLNLSVDYKPYYSPLYRQKGIKGFGFNEFGLSLRYVLQY
ncbi:MAG: hypothetical protein ACPG5P_00105 [Saprospiraceae bacterium]